MEDGTEGYGDEDEERGLEDEDEEFGKFEEASAGDEEVENEVFNLARENNEMGDHALNKKEEDYVNKDIV